MFIEICDFDEIVKSEELNLIAWLDNLFREFDNVCQKYHLQKIEVNF